MMVILRIQDNFPNKSIYYNMMIERYAMVWSLNFTRKILCTILGEYSLKVGPYFTRLPKIVRSIFYFKNVVHENIIKTPDATIKLKRSLEFKLVKIMLE